jgi:ribosomal-protein-alanine N-acetyltransferase
MDTTIEIRQATRNDLSRVALFLDSAPHIHRHLDWRNTFEWLDEPPFLMLENNEEIQAILSAAPEPPGYAWVRCFAVGRGITANAAWKALSKAAQPILSGMQAQLVAVSLQDWFSQVLIQNGFIPRQKIVVLEWNHHQPSAAQINPDILIRSMTADDLAEVADIDAKSFEPLWVNSMVSLRAAYLQAEHTTVAEYQEKIIGYELSTASQFTAHLARLAILPEFRKQAIGRTLVGNMLSHFAKRGIMQITVNTQNTNQASLRLYDTLGFRLTGEEYPVFSV